MDAHFHLRLCLLSFSDKNRRGKGCKPAHGLEGSVHHYREGTAESMVAETCDQDCTHLSRAGITEQAVIFFSPGL